MAIKSDPYANNFLAGGNSFQSGYNTKLPAIKEGKLKTWLNIAQGKTEDPLSAKVRFDHAESAGTRVCGGVNDISRYDLSKPTHTLL